MSRFRSIAPVVGLVLVIAGCSPATTSAVARERARHPAPRRPRRPPRQPASPSAAAGRRRRRRRQAFKGVNVNLLTFNGPQVAEPLQRRAPDFEALTGAHVNVDRRRLPDDLRQGAARRVDQDQQLRRLRLRPAVAGRLRRPGLPARPDRQGQRRHQPQLAGHRPVLPRLQRDLQRQGLHDPARRRLPHGLLPQRPADQGRPQAAGDLGRLPDDREEVPGPGPQRRRPARLRLVHRQEEGRPELLVDHLDRGRPAPEPRARTRAPSSTPRT